MLTYLLGDVLRIFSGDATPGQIGGITARPSMWMAAALLMLVPIVMVVVSVSFGGAPARWAHIVAAGGLFGVNLIGLPTYPSLYDRFLIVVGLGFKALTLWTAWNWQVS